MISTCILNGKALAQQLKHKVLQDVKTLKERNIFPNLAVIIVGEDPASHIYVNSKRRQCQEVGIQSQQISLPSTVCVEELAHIIHLLNQDKAVHGILIQLPLPFPLLSESILNLIDPLKDVDGLSALNRGKLLAKDHSGLLPCTPQGVLHLIKSTGIQLEGKKAVVVGRSMLVGIPTAHLLLQENCTLTLTHSYTLHLNELCQTADILVAACGQPTLIKGDWIKPGAVVIDVGIHRTSGGQLVGDVASHEAQGIAGYLSPVPGGVGPLTVAFLLLNTVLSASRRNN